ncbi:amino acid permease [Tabrizicola sp.]|uniref:amino acid permease n=1 Tax=Tabrizicola sp. TaxID=2005166 RepID=UPI003F2C090E
MASDDYTDKDKHEDLKVLHGMGYAQELSRSMSKFSNFAISFSIICILSGGINSFAQAISSVGGAGAGIGWIVGCLLSGMFALAMAQVASAFPTAGGLYHWASILGNRFWGWLTAWLNLLGLITVLGAINIGTAYFFQGAFGSMFGTTGADGAITPFPSSDWEIVGFVAVITVIQAIFNHIGIKATTFLTDISGYIIFLVTAVLVVACLMYAPAIDISRLWTFTNFSGPAGGGIFPESQSMGYLFLLCLLLPVYTITGYDASAHTSEETKNAAMSVPKGIVSAVFWSSLVGWIMICAIMLAVPDLAVGASQGGMVFFRTMETILPNWLMLFIFVGIFIAQLLCGLATVTSASRMLFAFSRDDGMPIGSKALASVSPKYRTPVNAIWTVTVLCILYVLLAMSIKVAETSIYFIVVNSTLIFLFLSFTVPLVAAMFAYGGPKWPQPGPWALSAGLYKLVTVLAVVGMAVILFIAVAPPNERVLYVVLGFIALALILWVAVENRRFEGPPTGERIAARKSVIAAAEAAVGEKA